MKKIVLLIAVSFLLMNQAYPQETKSLQVFINSGISLPLEPDYLKDYWRGNLNLSAGLNYPVFSFMDLSLSLNYNGFLFDEKAWRDKFDEYLLSIGEDPFGDELVVSGGMKNLLVVGLNAKIPFSIMEGRVTPYLIGGVDIVYNSTDNIIIGGFEIVSIDETRLGFNGGMGLDIFLGQNTSVFIEANYLQALTKEENKQEIPIQFFGEYKENKISYIYFKLGVTYYLSEK